MPLDSRQLRAFGLLAVVMVLWAGNTIVGRAVTHDVALLQNLGVGCSIAGVAVVVFQGEPANALRLHFGFGDVLILVAVLVWSLYTVLLRLWPAGSSTSIVAV